MIYWAVQKNILIAHTQKGLCAILLSGFAGEKDIDDQLEDFFPGKELQYVYDEKYAIKIINQLENNIDLDQIPIDFQCGTTFQKLVWSELRKIERGTTITYSELAERIGTPKAVRAVASAVANNPLIILVPCHRVVPKSGGVGKYRYGTQKKTYLLAQEGVIFND